MWGDVWGGGGSRCRSYIHATARTRHAARAAVRAGGVAPCRGGRPQRAGGRPPACRARAVRVGRCDQDSHRGSAGATLSVFFFFFRGAVLVDHVAEATTLHPARCDGGRAGGRAWGGRYAHEGLG